MRKECCPVSVQRQQLVMNNFFSNIWTKRVISLLGPLYCVCIYIFAYFSVFYTMSVRNPVSACVLISAVSLFAAVVMIYTRKQLLTKIVSLLMLPGLLLPTLMYFGQWEILIPPILVALLLFFFSGFGETTKTVFGTVFLLLYLLGSLIYFVVNSLFAPSTVKTTVETGFSPTGAYRYEVINTMDSSNGSTTVNVEPNTMDKDYDMICFLAKGLSRQVVVERPLQENTEVTWQTEKRADITSQIAGISSEITVTLSDAQMDLLGRDAYQVTYNNGTVVTMSQQEYHNTTVSLTPEQQAELETDQKKLALDKMGPNTMEILGITVDDFKTVPFSSLTDADLTALGIPEEGDVMYYDGRVVFRYYIAVLEEYFDVSNRDIGLL